MKLSYCFEYDSRMKDFYGYVYSEQTGITVYEISSSDEMVEMIESGTMEHIDDVLGLERHLKQERVIAEEDWIVADVLDAAYGIVV